MTAYSTPDRTAAYMARLDKNFDEIQSLKKIMRNPEVDLPERVMAFTKIFNLYHGDPHSQRRLVVELEYEAKRAQGKSHDQH